MANLKARSGSGDPKSGFRAFLERVSSRFRRVKPDAGVASASAASAASAVGKPVSISVTPAEPPSTPVKGLVIESVETTVSTAPTSGGEVKIEEYVNDDFNSSVFTLGFSAATNDLCSYAVAPLLGSFTRSLSSTTAPKLVGAAIPRGAVRAPGSIAMSLQQTFPPKRSSARKRQPGHRTRRPRRGSLQGAHSSLARPRPDGHSRSSSDTAAIPKPVVDVRSVLRRIGQEHHAELFEREEIDLRAFRELAEADLREMGISERADRQAILGSIKKM